MRVTHHGIDSHKPLKQSTADLPHTYHNREGRFGADGVTAVCAETPQFLCTGYQKEQWWEKIKAALMVKLPSHGQKR